MNDSLTVKKVFLLRHGKSSQTDPKQSDFDRTLDPEGKKQAVEMGEYVLKSGEKIELIVASPSVRTRETAVIICKKLKYDFNHVKWDSTIYLCSSDALLNCIKKTDNRYKSVLFLGHNNSITNVANMLQSEEKIVDVPPCGIVGIAFRDSVWNDMTTGKLLFYKSPK